MRNFTIGLITIFYSIVALGQVPQGITYQSVVRNPDGTIVSNAALSMQLTIRSGAPDGQIEYVEIHETQSNTYGLVNLIIGSGTVQEGDFSSINWGSNAMFLETAIDLGGSGNYESMGVTQFLSVPYSMFSGNGVHSMTTEERDALVNPPLGMQIFNITTNCINYFNGFGWYETCGECTPLPSEADAGPDQSFTGETTTAQMAANTPESGEGLWSVVSGEGGSFDDPSNPAATFSGQPCETYSLAWTITSPCGASEDLVEVFFDTPPTTADAGPDQTFNDETVSATLAANTAAIGTGTWTVESGEGGAFADASDPTTTFTGQPCETYTLKWTIGNDCGTSEDFVDIIFNTPPTTAFAGPDQTFNDATVSTTLAANTPLIGTGSWTIDSGTGGSFADVNDPTTTFTGEPCETYTLKWTITNDCGNSEDLVDIIFNTLPTTADAGPDQTFNDATITATLAANTPILGTGAWTIESGVGGSFVNASDPTTTFTGQPCETYTLKWTIANDCGTSEDFVDIVFNTPPTTADAGADQLDVQGTSTTLAGNTPVLGTGTWTILTGNGGVITEPANPVSMFSGVEGATYELQWTITNDCGNLSDQVVISFAGGTGTWECGQPIIDDRDGQQYETVQIGDQCWMAENLNVGIRIDGVESQTDNGTIEKYCFNNDPENCETYGGLYQWDEMMQYTTAEGTQGICPDGWYLPSDEEWKMLEGEADSQYGYPDPEWDGLSWRGTDAGGNLREQGTLHWTSPNMGATNSSGFTALPSGYRSSAGGWAYQSIGFFWTSTESDNNAYFRYVVHNRTDILRHNNYAKTFGLPVRCIKSDFIPVNQPPEQPSSPMPEDDSSNQSIEGTTISWTCTDPESDPITYDVYFGSANPPTQVATGQSESTYNPGTLQYTTEYFWKIVAHDDQGNTTEGPVWSFTSEEEPAAFACGEVLTDSRDGNTYETVQIGDQCWMAENLAYLPSVSPSSEGSSTEPYFYVYGYQGTDVSAAKASANFQTYGTLYNYPASQIACPDGWSNPSDDEWKILEGTVDSQFPVGDPEWDGEGWRGFDAGKNLKATSGWDDNGNGVDLYNFSALPGGFSYSGGFSSLGNQGMWWSSTEKTTTNVWGRNLWIGDIKSARYDYGKDYGRAVRCLKSDYVPVNQPPETPASPNPEDGATNQAIEGTTLSWTCTDPESDPLIFDIYFGTENPPVQVSTGQSESTYNPGTLQYTTEYFWKIVAHDDQGNSTEGVVWSFTTEEEPAAFACGEVLTDSRDGNTYQTVQIGDQCWMAQDLAWLPAVSPGSSGSITDSHYYVYGYQGTDIAEAKATENYQTYGALYNWPAMMNGQDSSSSIPSGVQGVCPDGWYLPSDEEWKMLEGSADSQYGYPDPEWDGTSWRGSDVSDNLREAGTSHWIAPNSGATNSSGFTSFPGGYRTNNGSFSNLGYIGFYWTTTDILGNSDNAWFRYLQYNNSEVLRSNNYNKSYALSVRCILNEGQENLPPASPSLPSPENGATNQAIEGTTLSWTCTDPENDPLTFDVYFGTENPPAQVSIGQTEISYDPGTLQYYTAYFWKIVSNDDQGNSTEGPVWSFTTAEDVAQFACGDIFTDTRDDNTYETVLIGDQCWMAENLAWLPAVSPSSSGGITEPHFYVYGYEGTDIELAKATTNYQTYGALYNWLAMMNGQESSSSVPSGVQGVCPDGWHLPSDEEWKILEGSADSQYGYPDPEWDGTSGRGSDVGGNLKEAGTAHWSPPNSGATNSSGFNAFPGGEREWSGSFLYLNNTASFWTTTNYSFYDNAWGRHLYFSDTKSIRSNNRSKDYGMSVRCVLGDTDNLPPASPTSPNPENGSANQPIEGTTLSWTSTDPESDPLTYDVYFAETYPPSMFSSGESETTYDPGTLQYATQYYWKIVAHDDQGNSTAGPVWSFTTAEEVAQFACGDIFTDTRDDNTYETVLIGEQCWMAENLAWLPSVSPSSEGSDAASYYYVYDYEGSDVSEAKATQNYQDLGVLYNWPAAQNACPEGWYTPNDAEWKVLEGNVDSQYPVGDSFWDQTDYRGFDAGKTLKSTSGWDDGGNGVDTYGFTAKPAGGRSPNGHFFGIGAGGRFWTLNEASAEHGWYRILFGVTDSVYRAAWEKGLGYSMRCIYGEVPANQPPSAPHYGEPNYWSDPQPVEGTILTWSSLDYENDPLTFDVYFGTSDTPSMVASGQSESNYNLGTLEYGTQYFWKVVAHDNQGNTTNGPLWTFKTLGPEVGDEFGGGIVAYIFQQGDPGYVEGETHGIIAATTDQSNGVPWGCAGELIGASGVLIGTGAGNTEIIISGCSTPGIAARICQELELNGYDDWFLPSKAELNQLFLNREVIGGFVSAYYWSSSETTHFVAASQHMVSGATHSDLKGDSIPVRAIRVF